MRKEKEGRYNFRHQKDVCTLLDDEASPLAGKEKKEKALREEGKKKTRFVFERKREDCRKKRIDERKPSRKTGYVLSIRREGGTPAKEEAEQVALFYRNKGRA